MPIYEYRCPGCHKRFATIVLSPSARREAPACPKCGRKKAERLVSRFATSPKSDDFGSDFGAGDDLDGGGFGEDDAAGPGGGFDGLEGSEEDWGGGGAGGGMEDDG